LKIKPKKQEQPLSYKGRRVASDEKKSQISKIKAEKQEPPPFK
jgi:hypothetical protein